MEPSRANRTKAGELRGTAGRERLGREPVAVLGMPRGGVPMAAGVARTLGSDLEVLVVRNVGVPGRPEFAMGAVGAGGVPVRTAEVPCLERPANRTAVGECHEEVSQASDEEVRNLLAAS
jgi:putative phosphoribosyl transferase